MRLNLPRVVVVVAVVLGLASGPMLHEAQAACGGTSPSGCPMTSAQMHDNGDGTSCYTVWYGGTNSSGNTCMGVCEEGNCSGGPLPMINESLTYPPASGSATTGNHPAPHKPAHKPVRRK